MFQKRHFSIETCLSVQKLRHNSVEAALRLHLELQRPGQWKEMKSLDTSVFSLSVDFSSRNDDFDGRVGVDF